MGRADYYDSNSYNALCDRCGFKFKAHQLKEEWNGLMVCSECWEPRHPQDFLRGIPDDPSVPWSRPDSDADTSATDIDGNSLSTINSIKLVDNANLTYIWGTYHPVVEYYTELTNNRTLTISALGSPKSGDRIIVYRTAGGDGTLAITAAVGGAIKTIPASVNAVVISEYTGSLWKLVDYYTLGL